MSQQNTKYSQNTKNSLLAIYNIGKCAKMLKTSTKLLILPLFPVKLDHKQNMVHIICNPKKTITNTILYKIVLENSSYRFKKLPSSSNFEISLLLGRMIKDY